MSGRINSRVKPEAWQYFESRMNEWHLNNTETLHRLISEHEQLGIDKKKLEGDLDVMRDLIAHRPLKSEADQKKEAYKTPDCLRGLRFPTDQKPHFCDNCRRNHPSEHEACQKLKESM